MRRNKIRGIPEKTPSKKLGMLSRVLSNHKTRKLFAVFSKTEPAGKANQAVVKAAKWVYSAAVAKKNSSVYRTANPGGKIRKETDAEVKATRVNVEGAKVGQLQAFYDWVIEKGGVGRTSNFAALLRIDIAEADNKKTMSKQR